MEVVDETTKNLIKYVSIPISIGGLVFNTLAYFIFSRQRFQKHKIAYYSRINILTHTFNLLVHLTCYYFLLIEIDLRLVSNFMCKFYQLLLRSTVQLSSWIEILITYDRNNSIRWQNRLQIKDKRTFRRLVIMFIFFVFILNTPNLGFQLVKPNELSNTSLIFTLIGVNQTIRKSFCLAEPKIYFMREFLLKVFGIYLPLVVMVYMNVNLFRDLLNSSKHAHIVNLNEQSLTKRNCVKKNIFKREINYGLAIFALNVLFLLTHLPIAIVIIIVTIESMNSPIKLNESNINRLYFMNVSTMFTIGCYYSSTFFINILFNKHFYTEFIIILNSVKDSFIPNRQKNINSSNRFESNRRTLEPEGTVMYECSIMRQNNKIQSEI